MALSRNKIFLIAALILVVGVAIYFLAKGRLSDEDYTLDELLIADLSTRMPFVQLKNQADWDWFAQGIKDYIAPLVGTEAQATYDRYHRPILAWFKGVNAAAIAPYVQQYKHEIVEYVNSTHAADPLTIEPGAYLNSTP